MTPNQEQRLHEAFREQLQDWRMSRGVSDRAMAATLVLITQDVLREDTA